MSNVYIQPDCGNSPRKLFLKDFTTAVAKGDIYYLNDKISETIEWEIIGQSKVASKEKYLSCIPEHRLWKAKELVVDTIITHGPDASVCGQIITKNNSKFAFCDIYRFKGAAGVMINSIRTFLIQEL